MQKVNEIWNKINIYHKIKINNNLLNNLNQ
jgi:hypothetical protein